MTTGLCQCFTNLCHGCERGITCWLEVLY